MYLILGIIFILIGLLMVVFPEFIYELQESFRSDMIGTPSKLYIISTRFGGVMFILVGLMGIIGFFFG